MNDQEKQYAMNQESFYRGQVFGMLEARLDRIEKDSQEAHKELQQSINDIKSKINWIYGFAAAIGFTASFAWDWLKNKL